jgi:hypothetical protein
VLVFLIWVAFNIALGLVLLAVPRAVRSFVSSVIAGTLLAPFYALVVPLVYYRLSEAHAGAVPPRPRTAGAPSPRRPRRRSTCTCRRHGMAQPLRACGSEGVAVRAPRAG